MTGLYQPQRGTIKIEGRDAAEISNQEKTVYDIIERKPENPEEANVLPPSEQPNADAIEALVEEVTAKENAAPAAKTNEIRAEALAAQLLKDTQEKPAKKPAGVDYLGECARHLEQVLGRKVRMTQGRKTGRIELEYYGTADLHALLEALEKLGKR